MSRRQIVLLVVANACISLAISLVVVHLSLERWEARLPTYAPLVLPSPPSSSPAWAGDFLYVVQPGDSLSSIAIRFDVSIVDLMRANGITNPDFIHAGQRLIIPSGPVPEPSESPTATRLPFDAPTPVLTGSPVATGTPGFATTPIPGAGALRILQIENAGVFDQEAVSIWNAGDEPIQLEDWTLTDGAGHSYQFARHLLEPADYLRLHTRSGEDMPPNLHWGLEASIWEQGSKVLIVDRDGEVVAEFDVE